MTFTMNCHIMKDSLVNTILLFIIALRSVIIIITTINFIINGWKNNFFSPVDVVKMLVTVRMLLLHTCVLSEQPEQFIFICLSEWIQLYIYEYICLFVCFLHCCLFVTAIAGRLPLIKALVDINYVFAYSSN